jgi:large subunit ribosomal protein L21
MNIDMYALVEILGKQYKAVEGETIQVDHINKMEEGASLEYSTVLAVVDESSAKFGTPYVANAKVTATYVGDKKGDKIRVFKYEKRKGYRRTQGHRQQYSMITINKITA